MVKLWAASYLAPAFAPVYEALARAAARALGAETRFSEELDYGLLEGPARPELAFVCGLPCVDLGARALYEPVAAPVPSGARYRGRPLYFSEIVVPQASAVHSLAELRGARFGYNEIRSHSGYGIVAYHLAAHGGPAGFFAELVATGYHERSLELVAAGELDGAALDSHLLDLLRARRPELVAAVRVVDVLGPSTIQPLAVSTELPASARAAAGEAVVAAARAPSLRRLLAAHVTSGWVRVDQRSYDDIAAMAATSSIVGP